MQALHDSFLTRLCKEHLATYIRPFRCSKHVVCTVVYEGTSMRRSVVIVAESGEHALVEISGEKDANRQE